MRPNTAAILLLFLFLASPSAAARARRAPPPPVSYLELARGALERGATQDAVRALAEARSCWKKRAERCGFVRADYEALLGVTYLELGEAQKAAATLQRVLATQPQRTALWLYLGQAQYRLEHWGEAAEAFARGASAGAGMPGYFALAARAHANARQPERARAVLLDGLERFPGEPLLVQEALLLYAQLGLAGELTAIARAHLGPAEVEQRLLASERLREAGSKAAARELLEESRLLSSDPRLSLQLAYLLLEDGEPLAASRLFAAVAEDDDRHALEASESYRAAGRIREALRLNQQVPDENRRLKQRLLIHLEDRAWSRALVLEPALRKAGALDDEARYHLAHAALRIARFDDAARLLDEIAAEPWSASAASLRATLEQCRARPWSCR